MVDELLTLQPTTVIKDFQNVLLSCGEEDAVDDVHQ